MTLKTKKFLVRVGEFGTIVLIYFGIRQNPQLIRTLFMMVGSWRIGQLIGLAGKTLIQQYEAEDAKKDIPS